MKNFANNTFWRRAAMTLLLAVITTTAALADYFVLFNPNGGQSMGLPVRQVFSANTPQALMLNTYTRDGYDFDGWNTEKDGTGTSYADGQTITATHNIVLYAQWKQSSGTDDTIKYYIEYDPNGATKNGIPAIPIRKSINGGQVTILYPCTYSRSGFDFIGWNTAADGSGTAYADQQRVVFTSDVTLYAQWDTICGHYKLDEKTNTLINS
ncbi:MAG: InlB B-repeat-containing protein, partial [Bacteroidaceae bacterium]|nr:InlB B-repeat-containing protein [Bacteroidaceae bacterium]